MVTCLHADGMKVVGDTASLGPAPDLSSVDVLVFDAERDGLHAASKAVAGRGIALIALVESCQSPAVSNAVAAGVAGVLVRTELDPGALCSAVRAALDGHVALPGAVLRSMLSRAAGGLRLGSAELSEREVNLLRMLGDGDDTREIASALCYSERTVKNLVHDMLIKLNCRNRTHAVAIAARQGVI
jgi:DNA-binding NarL/FixJ family response regulator